MCNTFCKINQNCWCCVASVQSGSSPPNQKLLPTPLMGEVCAVQGLLLVDGFEENSPDKTNPGEKPYGEKPYTF